MPQKIVFMGTPEFSVPTLDALINSKHKILAVYSQPASKANRGQKKVPSQIEIFAKEKSLKLRTPENLNNEEEYNFFKKISPDIVVVVAYGQIIPTNYLNLPKNGFINIHASLLPKWRGAAPIQRSIINLDKETGISIMKIVEELDAGPIMHQDKIEIDENIDALTLSKTLSKLGANSIIESIDKIEKGTEKFIEQNNSKATYAKKILKSEAKINWNESAKKVLAKINALNPNPGAWFEYNKERYKVWKAKIVNKNGVAGRTVDDQLTVSCFEHSIKILEIQKEGKNKKLVDQFLLGNKINKGEHLL
jgi:methionyl-tRNA formyltransferase